MNETPFHHDGEDGALYTVDVIRDRRDEANPHYDVDLVRSMTGRFGESIEQRLTLGEYEERSAAHVYRDDVERTIDEQGLGGVGDAKERILKEPVLYDGQYLFVTYPPDAEGTDRAAAHLLHFDGAGMQSERMAVGAADAMLSIVEAGEQEWAESKLPNMLPDPERHPLGDSGFTRDDSMTIHDTAGREWASHLDGEDTSHWFAIVESEPAPADSAAQPFELRYFRALEGEDGLFKHDSYPVMPLPDDRRESAWPLPGLEMYLERGDVYMAQQFAHDVADNNGMDFPPPLALPALDPEPDYYFGYGVSPNNQPSLEAVKTWMDGAERRFDTFTIAEYGMYEEARVDEQELDDLMHDKGLEAAMNVAERMAVAGGYLDPQRQDGRVFFEDDAPRDPFTTVRERELEQERAVEDAPTYAVDAISANGSSHLDVTKEWGEGEHAHLIIPQPDWDTAAANAQTAYDLMLNDDLQGAMTLVEVTGVEAGVIDPQRDDPRLFTDGPPDPFTTIRERELAAPDMDTEPLAPVSYPTMYAEWAEETRRERESNALLEGSAWFEATFDKPERELLQPIDDTVNYSVVVQEVDPWTTELAVEKYWKEPNGYLGIDSQTIQTFDSDDEAQRQAAEAAREGLLEVYDERGLEAMMHQAELNAMQNGHLEGGRRDERLFRDGPPDRFETLAQQLADEPNPYWNLGDDRVEEAPAPGSWEELIAQQPGEEPEPERHYWQMHYRPVETPEGESLGTALFVTEFPQLPPNFDDYVEEYSMDDSVYPTEARTLEMAHFANAEDAKKFEKEFRSYLIPDLIDGPELAPEVAKLEGLSGEWQEMDYQGIVDYMSGSRTIVREESDWHLHNPNAERDARIEAEGLYIDSLHSLQVPDDQSITPTQPSIDLEL